MIDLHMHSTRSDGTYTPTELMRLAKENNLKVVSLTDHDTIDGLEEASAEAKRLGIEFVNGIELSADFYGKEVHILGFGFDANSEKLVNKLTRLKSERVERTKWILDKLKEYKINISYEEVKNEAPEDLISRTHIATVMIKKGLVYSRKEAFQQYLGVTGVAYLPKKNTMPEEAVQIIRESGGLAFIAHPKLIPYGQKKFFELLDLLQPYGLSGLEVYYPHFTDIDIEYYNKIAKERKLLVSGGSDFHGGNRMEVSLGQTTLPQEGWEKIKAKLKK